MSAPALPPAKEWTPDWWSGPSPLILIAPEDWPDDTSPRGRSAVIEESGEEVALGSFLFRFRSTGGRGLVFCRNTDGDLDRAELNRLAFTPGAKWQRGPQTRKGAARKKTARKRARKKVSA